MSQTFDVENLDFFSGGGEMGALIRAHDWASTPIGSPGRWPQSLRTAVRLMLSTRHPMYIWWGADLVCFYNDAYRMSIGPERHPSSLGRPGREVWAEIWDIIGPQIDLVMSGGGATWNENHLVPITRDGKREDVYWTYSFGPIDDPLAPCRVGGVLVVCTETTAAVQSQRRMEEAAARQREVFQQAPGFVIVMDGPQHRVQFVNRAHMELFGSQGWEGMAIRDAFPDIEGQGFFELLDEVYRSGIAYESRQTPVRFRTPDDVWKTRYLNFTYAPVFDEARKVTGIFCEGFEVTEQQAVQAALESSEQQLRLAVEAADVGLWDVDIVANTLYWPARVRAMFGIFKQDVVTMDDFYAGLHPDDLEHTSHSFALAMDPDVRGLYDVEYRTIGKEDSLVRWVAAKGRGIFSDDGTCIRVIGTAVDISARKSMEQLIADSQAQLQLEDKRKDEFLATLSHELRNPLSAISGAAKVLHLDGVDAAMVTKCAGMIERQASAMKTLLDELLEVTRIRLGKIQLKRTSASVRQIVEATCETVAPLIDAKRHALHVHLPEPDVCVNADAVRVSQVLTNLVHNAAKYSDPGARIDVLVDAVADEVRFRVIDTGIGICAEDLPGVFGMFAQPARGLSRSQGGLGIGLALSQRLVQLHHGRLAVASEGAGKGCTFTMYLPAAQRPTSGFEPLAHEPSAGGRRQSIVVVDDNPDAAETLSLLLVNAGFPTRFACGGEAALRLVQSSMPDVCLVDIGMPGMDGFEFVRCLRTLPSAHAVTCIATTGWGREEDRAKALASGFDHHMTKPIDAATVVALLERQFSTAP